MAVNRHFFQICFRVLFGLGKARETGLMADRVIWSERGE